LHALPRLDASSIDAVITDPPYGINFNGMAWDGRGIADATRSDLAIREKLGTPGRTRGGSAFGSPSSYAGAYDFTPRGMQAFQAFSARWAHECLRVLKPGGHLAAFASPRTAHRLSCGLEEAGFELRDVVMWIHGQGFPKSLNLGGAMSGWGTALRPAYEPIVLARKPLQLPTRENVRRHGTGALNIDACRQRKPAAGRGCEGRGHTRGHAATCAGRWPPNFALSHGPSCTEAACGRDCPAALLGERERFFYCPKASRREREAGCEGLSRHTIQTFQIGASNERRAKANPVANVHPTVKPIELMRWIVRLITPCDGLVLDPFAGSATTGAAAVLEGARFLGIEREAEYIPIARARVRYWAMRAREASRQPR
jgi:site-specific DNA-methyltransferase (adenine-specific)